MSNDGPKTGWEMEPRARRARGDTRTPEERHRENVESALWNIQVLIAFLVIGLAVGCFFLWKIWDAAP